MCGLPFYNYLCLPASHMDCGKRGILIRRWHENESPSGRAGRWNSPPASSAFETGVECNISHGTSPGHNCLAVYTCEPTRLPLSGF